MNRKKIIIIIAIALAAVIALIVGISLSKGDETEVPVDENLPFSVSIRDNSVTVKFSGKSDWQYSETDGASCTVEETKNNTFVITSENKTTVGASFYATEDEKTVYTGSVVIDFSGDEIKILDAVAGTIYEEQSFCEDTELPFTFTSDADGSAVVLITKNSEGIWEYECKETVSVEQGLRDESGIRFYIASKESGEFSVTLNNVTLGLSCEILLEADENLCAFVKSATVGECEVKAGDDKEAEKEEDAKALADIKADFTDINIFDGLTVGSASYEETAEGKTGLVSGKYLNGSFVVNMRNYALTDGFGYDYTNYEKSSARINGNSVTLYSADNGSTVAEWTSKSAAYRLVADELSQTELQQLITSLTTK